jgi:hypothetical protein
MAGKNLEVANAIYSEERDLVAVFASPETLDAARGLLEPLFEPGFVTVHDPQAIALGIGTTTGGGLAEGIEGFIALWRDYLTAWESWVVSPVGFTEVDDERVLVLLDYHGRSKTHGVEMALEGGNLLTVRDGRVARVELFLRRPDALAAAGLPE